MRIFDEVVLAGLDSPQGPIVVADDVANWMHSDPRDRWHIHDDFGPLVPPFDRMWIEWRGPPGHYPAMAVQVISSPCESGTAVAMRIVVLIGAGKVCQQREAVTMILDHQGRFVSEKLWTEEGHTVPDSLAEVAGVSSLLIPLLAISLMHCKNVGISDATTPAKRNKRARSLPQRTYSVVKMPRAVAKGAKANRESLGEIQPLHLVRGHFKTYTDDAPLFGSRVGTYWWGWQARGVKEAGERLHSYEVGLNG